VATERKGMTAAEFEDGLFDMDGASEFANILIYGDPGSQKTRLTGTLPGTNLFLAAEPGYISAARNGFKGQARMITDTAAANAAVSWLEDGNASRFDFLVVDGGSSFMTKILLEYAAEAYDLSNGTKRAHRNLPDKPDYLNAQNFMKGWTARLIDLPCHLIMTTHVMVTEDREGDAWVKPNFQGKAGEVSDYIAGQFHVVGFLKPASVKVKGEGDEKPKVKQIIKALWNAYKDDKTDITYFAKDQFGVLGRTSTDPNMTEIIERITGAPFVSRVESAAPAKKNRKK
jgi:carbon monoxide dehydrogenase subunit G